MTKTQNDQLHQDELHMQAGPMLAPLFTWQGLNVYPVFGAEGDDDGDGDPDSKPDDDDTDDDAGKGEDEGSSDTVTRDEFEKLRKQLSAADKNKSAAEKKLKEIEDAKKDELTKATERVEELTKQTAKQATELAEMRLQNAFLTADTGITWHDPADALDVAERRGYLAEVVGEDGKVDGKKLGTKLKELAKAKPHLVKGSSDKEDKQDKDRTPPSGSAVGSKGSSNGNKGDKIPSRYEKYLR